jgi:hypothetical protein
MPDRLNGDVLARFDELLAALARCDEPDERAQLISRFASDEAVFIERAEIEFLRARDQVSDEELNARMRAAPDMGGATLVEMMKKAAARGSAAPNRDGERGENYRSALSLAMLLFLSVVQGVLALLELRDGANAGKVAALTVGTLASAGLGSFIGVSWLRDLRRQSEVDEHRSWTDAAFDESNERVGGRAELERVDVSDAHLRMSDALMNDALAGVLSPRGACDTAFDAGYFALLGALSAGERRAFEHPSERVVVLASSRLGLNARRGEVLARIRYSADEWPALTEVVAWAEGVREAASRQNSSTGRQP